MKDNYHTEYLWATVQYSLSKSVSKLHFNDNYAYKIKKSMQVVAHQVYFVNNISPRLPCNSPELPTETIKWWW